MFHIIVPCSSEPLLQILYFRVCPSQSLHRLVKLHQPLLLQYLAQPRLHPHHIVDVP